MLQTFLILVISLPLLLIALLLLWQRRTINKFKKVNDKAKFDVMPSASLFDSMKNMLFPRKTFFLDREVELAKLYSRGERVYHAFMGPKSMVIVLHPEDAQKILMSTTTYDRIKPLPGSTFHRLVSQSIAQVPSDEWRRHRSTMYHAFANLDNYVPTFDETIQHLFNLWDAKINSKKGFGEIEVDDQMQRMTLDVLAKTIFGKDLGAIDGRADKIRDDYHKISELIFSQRDYLFPWLKTKEQSKSIDNFEEGIKQIIESRIEERKKNDNLPFTMLDSMIESVDDESGTGFTTQQLIHNVIGFFLAGHETVFLN
jgi:cytochrome P450